LKYREGREGCFLPKGATRLAEIESFEKKSFFPCLSAFINIKIQVVKVFEEVQWLWQLLIIYLITLIFLNKDINTSILFSLKFYLLFLYLAVQSLRLILAHLKNMWQNKNSNYNSAK
jgi:hypothetical protein